MKKESKHELIKLVQKLCNDLDTALDSLSQAQSRIDSLERDVHQLEVDRERLRSGQMNWRASQHAEYALGGRISDLERRVQ